MQWLIDLIKEWIGAQGYLTTSYVDRGDPAAYDYDKTDFTVDGNFHDLDLSSIVPAGAKAVKLYVFTAGDSGWYVIFRRNGNSNEVNVATERIQVSVIKKDFNLIVACDENRSIEYKMIIGTNWTTFNFVVCGWWL